jgi:hypothetical protein
MLLRVEDQMFPLGWYVDIAASANRWLSMVGEVSGAYKVVRLTHAPGLLRPEPIPSFPGLEVRLHGFMTGGRINVFPDRRRVSPFAQLLIGGLRFSAGLEGDMDFEDDGSNGSGIFFGIQAGGGVDIRMTERIAVRAAGDYRHMFQLLDTENQLRLVTGVVVSFSP